MGTLDGRTALVTGGARGIGRGIALRLARDGALVAVFDRDPAKETVAEIEEAGGRAFAIQGELGVPGDARNLWSAFEERIGEHTDREGVDILVNNAAVAAYAHIHEVSEELYDQVFAVNAKAPFFIVKEGLSRLRDGGRIINLSSGVTKVAMPDLIAYSAAKGSIDVLTLTLAQELGSRGITVNAVAPGTVDTPIHPWIKDEERRTLAAGYSVFGRLGQPADIADVVGFLASDDSRWVTGQVIDVSGGSALAV
ncbi:SDR family oxidoreductase [Nocardiopsis metallicus]|uniref:NAD(P)-dependent dehydrogenase (Short-subunit alcohol dehydrogenase family) n=1 Tax=Nocardiopsis metallicus TaxID=179819 RepID=A0A840VZ27_9ACTN|nr:SDR family oxidoreductase [Nocardiopsis metallicus]MBB5489709.1 NAD(P)-dependent dehydrogenase (short-subunit alcohol dehydrogenase family) [Nocardiopsis metallicus]